MSQLNSKHADGSCPAMDEYAFCTLKPAAFQQPLPRS
jgi:hypothetical protein